MLALAVMTMVAAALGTMALAVQTASDYTRNQGLAVQHARVVLDRIDRTIQKANVSESFPGFLVLSWTEGSGSFPDTLVVWVPTTAAADPNGVPRANELVIFRPDPNNPGSLLEITNPSETPSTTYSASSHANWRTLVTTLTNRSNAKKVVLTNLLRTGATSSSSNATRRGAIRFRYSSAPSDTEIANYRAGTATWPSLAWPQDFCGKSKAMRSLACFTEIQMAPDSNDMSSSGALPFFGSSVLWKEVSR